MAKKLKQEELTAAQLVTLMAGTKDDIVSLQAMYDEYAKKLLALLHSEGRIREGKFSIATRRTLKVVDMGKALEWAKGYNVLKLDTAKAMQVLRRELTLPEFFKVEASEYITTAGNREPQE